MPVLTVDSGPLPSSVSRTRSASRSSSGRSLPRRTRPPPARRQRCACASTTPAVIRKQPAQPGSPRAIANEDAAARQRRPRPRAHVVADRGPARSSRRSSSTARPSASQRVVDQLARLADLRRRTRRGTPRSASAAGSAAAAHDVEAEGRHTRRSGVERLRRADEHAGPHARQPVRLRERAADDDVRLRSAASGRTASRRRSRDTPRRRTPAHRGAAAATRCDVVRAGSRWPVGLFGLVMQTSACRGVIARSTPSSGNAKSARGGTVDDACRRRRRAQAAYMSKAGSDERSPS